MYLFIERQKIIVTLNEKEGYPYIALRDTKYNFKLYHQVSFTQHTQEPSPA